MLDSAKYTLWLSWKAEQKTLDRSIRMDLQIRYRPADVPFARWTPNVA